METLEKPRSASPTGCTVASPRAMSRLKARVKRLSLSEAAAESLFSEPVNRVLAAPCYGRAVELYNAGLVAAAALMFRAAADACDEAEGLNPYGACHRAAANLRQRSVRAHEACLARMDTPKWWGEDLRSVRPSELVKVVGEAELVQWLPGRELLRRVCRPNGVPLVEPGETVTDGDVRIAINDGLLEVLAAAVK